MFKKSRVKDMLWKWEAFLAYGGERRILEAIRSSPKDQGFLAFERHVTPVFEGIVPQAVQNEYKSRDAVPSRNERERGILELRLQVHRKLDDTVWPYLWSAMQSFKCADMYQVYIDARGLLTNYYSPSQEFKILASIFGFWTSGEKPRHINHNLCSIMREGTLKIATLSVGSILSVPFYYSHTNTVHADVKQWKLPNRSMDSLETCIYNQKITWGKGGTWTPVVEGFEAFYAESPQQWNAHVHVEPLYDNILKEVPIPFAETLLSYQESELDDG